MRLRTALIALALAGAVWRFWPMGAPTSLPAPPPVALEAGALTDPPRQRALPDGPRFTVDGIPAQALAEYALSARVLAARRYRLGHTAALAPLDLALGWGRMSDPAVIARLDIAQRHRWYLWSYSGAPPLPVREIETSSANVHLIPADDAVAARLANLRTGDAVTLRGYLLGLERADGWRWRSSLTREDTGDGACELLYVQQVARR